MSTTTGLRTPARADVAGWWRDRAPWQALTLATTGIVLLVLRQLRPNAFFVGDKQNQYVPVFSDIGRRLRGGEIPLIDPALGPSGNYSLDVQYGTFDPAHWLMAVMVSHISDRALAAFVLSLVYSCVLALGATCVAQRLGVRGWWSTVAGFSAATAGYVGFQLSPEWIPGLLSLAWMPWLWWALAGRVNLRRALLVALFTYLVIAGGWPSTWLTFGALTVGVLVESLVVGEPGRRWPARLGPLLIRSTAALGGLLVAFLNVVPALRADAWTVRHTGVEQTGFLVPNLLDVFNNIAPRTTVPMNTFGVDVQPLPYFFFGWFVVALLWTTRWSRALWRHPGVLTGVVASVVAVATTQLPSQMGALRVPIRQLAGFQVLTVITVLVIAAAAGLVVTRLRVVGMLLTVAGMVVVSATRDLEPGSNMPWTAITVAALLVVVVLVGRVGGRSAWLGLWAWTLTVALFVVAWLGAPLRSQLRDASGVLGRPAMPVTRAERPAIALYPMAPTRDYQAWLAEGVGRGFQRLTATQRLMPGYSSVSSLGFRENFKFKAAHGYARMKTVKRLMKRETRTHEPWFALLGLRTAIVHRSLMSKWRETERGSWEQVGGTRSFVRMQRSGTIAVAGRITYVDPGVSARKISVSNAEQSYEVSAPQGGLVVFRDLYWPGYEATLDGRPISIRPLDDTLVAVRLPKLPVARLQITWQPLTPQTWGGLGGGGVALVLLASGAGWWTARRRRRDEAESSASDGTEADVEPVDDAAATA